MEVTRPRVSDPHQALVHAQYTALFLDETRDSLPHLSRPKRRIAKAIHQCLDCTAAACPARDETPHERGERQTLDPLRGPLRADFGAWHAPDLFRVAAEKNFVEPPSKCVHHPIFKASDRCLATSLRPQIAQQTADRLERAKFSQRFEWLQRYLKNLPL